MMLVKRPRNASILRNRTLTRKNCLPARESVDSPSRVIEMEDVSRSEIERERKSNCCSRSTPGNSRENERGTTRCTLSRRETQLLLPSCYIYHTSNRVSGLFPNELEDDDRNEILGRIGGDRARIMRLLSKDVNRRMNCVGSVTSQQTPLPLAGSFSLFRYFPSL